MSKPTVGRVVHFHASTFCITATGPWPALITKVYSDRCVTLGGFDEWGKPFALTSCIFVLPGEPAPATGPYAYWPPGSPQAKVEDRVPPKPAADTGDQAIEREILQKGLTAPRVTPADLQANIAHTEIVKYVSDSGKVLRWAVLTCNNGFACTGRPSVAVSPANDDEEVGIKVAVDNARNELWGFMGYELCSRLAEAARTDATYIASEG